MLRGLVERRRAIGGVGALVELVKHGAPSVVESQVNSKDQLERELKASCERYIATCTSYVVAPLLGLLPPNRAAEPAASTRSPPPLEVYDAALGAAEAAFEAQLRPAHARMCAYLPDATTQCILFGPVGTNVLEACGQLQTHLNAAGAPPEYAGRLARLTDALNTLTALASTAPDAALHSSVISKNK